MIHKRDMYEYSRQVNIKVGFLAASKRVCDVGYCIAGLCSRGRRARILNTVSIAYYLCKCYRHVFKAPCSSDKPPWCS